MSASISNPAAVDRQRLPFSEWLTLRRHPLPEYRDSLDALPPSLAEMARAALLPSDEVQGALFVPAEYHARKMVRWEYVPERGLVFLQDGLLQLSAESSERAGAHRAARRGRAPLRAFEHLALVWPARDQG